VSTAKAKRPKGRPRNAPEAQTQQVAVRLSQGLLAALDRECDRMSVERFGAKVTRSEAIKALLVEALRAREKPWPATPGP
jgi:metal-responsive CopG/Arc/MetJ family transcriptional regulator